MKKSSQTKEKIPAVLIHGCLVCVGFFLLFVGILFSQENVMHRRRAVKLKGQVVSFVPKRVSKHNKFYPQIEFIDPTTQRRILFFPNVFPFYQPFEKGDNVDVFYNPQTQKILVDDWLLIYFPGYKSIFFGVLLSGIGLLSIFIIFIHSLFRPSD